MTRKRIAPVAHDVREHTIPMACNEATADMLVASPLFANGYRPRPADFRDHDGRLA